MVEYGMNIPVDGFVFQAVQLTTDEAAMTGESVELKKDLFLTCKARRSEIEAE
jgi:magnesium-transporting ATPase (P-type)